MNPITDSTPVDATTVIVATISLCATVLGAWITQWLQGRKIHGLVNSQAQLAREVLAAAYEHIAELTKKPTDIQRAKDARLAAQPPKT